VTHGLLSSPVHRASFGAANPHFAHTSTIGIATKM
jgi:hypothetical protein